MGTRSNVQELSHAAVRVRRCCDRIRYIKIDINHFNRLLELRRKALKYELQYLKEIEEETK